MSRFQFDVPTAEGVGAQAAVVSFVQKVFLWMTAGLAITGAVAAWLGASPEFVKGLVATPGALIGIFIGQLVLVMVLSAAVSRISSTAAAALYVLYAVSVGVTFSVIFLVFTGTSIAVTFFVTAGTFGVTGVYGFVTKRDLSRLGSLLFMALIGLILASVANWFLRSSAISWLTTYAGIAIFVGLTAYDMQKVKRLAEAGVSGEIAKKAAIMGALHLYLDFINLFLLLLRLFGRRR